MTNDFITNELSNLSKSKDELNLIKRELIHRHVAWLTALEVSMLRKDRPWEMHLQTSRSIKNVETEMSMFMKMKFL